MKINWKRLMFSFGICFAAAIAGSLYTAQSVSRWYPTLIKPFLNPPAWVFGPVWTILFIWMGYALYLVWDKGLKKKGVADAVALFGVQLILNVTWSYLFFGLRNPLLALIEIIILWSVILQTTLKFARIDRIAAYLMLPYLLWVGFASYLNLMIVLLN
jgi:tryptophan-rich sensory protein